MKSTSEQLLTFAENELVHKESIRQAVLNEAPRRQKKPVAWTKILLPIAACLVLLCGVVFAIPSARAEVLRWFDSVFSNSSEQIGKEREEQSEQFQSVREKLKGLPLEIAGDLEMWMDFQEESARMTQRVLREAAKSAVPVNQTADGVTFAEFSVYDTPGMESAAARHLFFGFSAPLSREYADNAVVFLDGIEKSAFRMDVPFAEEDTAHYAIYECIPDLSPAYLPETSLVVMKIGSAQFCFRYCWTDCVVELPADNAEKAAWLEQNDRLCEAARSMSCVCLTEPVTNDGITVTITNLTIENNDLIVDADVEATSELSDLHAQVFENKLRVRNRTYSIGVTLSVSRLLPDDFDFSASLKHHTRWRISLPIPANELAGEVVAYSFYIHAAKLTDRDPEDDGLRTKTFRFEFRFNA